MRHGKIPSVSGLAGVEKRRPYHSYHSLKTEGLAISLSSSFHRRPTAWGLGRAAVFTDCPAMRRPFGIFTR
jgi:hypothetical protein